MTKMFRHYVSRWWYIPLSIIMISLTFSDSLIIQSANALSQIKLYHPLRIECPGGWNIVTVNQDGSGDSTSRASLGLKWYNNTAFIDIQPLPEVDLNSLPFSGEWNASNIITMHSPNAWTRADWDFDGNVDLRDFALFQNAWANFQK